MEPDLSCFFEPKAIAVMGAIPYRHEVDQGERDGKGGLAVP
jgi:hypothetical protein